MHSRLRRGGQTGNLAGIVDAPSGDAIPRHVNDVESTSIIQDAMSGAIVVVKFTCMAERSHGADRPQHWLFSYSRGYFRDHFADSSDVILAELRQFNRNISGSRGYFQPLYSKETN